MIPVKLLELMRRWAPSDEAFVRRAMSGEFGEPAQNAAQGAALDEQAERSASEVADIIVNTMRCHS